MHRLLLLFAVFLFPACSRSPDTPPAAPAAPGIPAAEEAALRRAAELFLECKQKEGGDERFKECVDLAEYERRIFHDLKRAEPSGIFSSPERAKMLEESAQVELRLAKMSAGFPVAGAQAALVGLSPRGRPVLRWKRFGSDGLEFGELIPAEKRNGADGAVKFVDLERWAWGTTASALVRARMVTSPVGRFGIPAAWVTTIRSGWERDVLDHLVAGRLLTDDPFSSYQPREEILTSLPRQWRSLPATFQELDVVALNLAVLATADEAAGDKSPPPILAEAKALWEQRHPDSPALLLRRLESARGFAKLADLRRLQALLTARGVSDPLLHQVIAGGLYVGGQVEEAQREVDAARALFPGDGPLRWLAFRVAVERKDYANAAAQWHALLKDYPLAAGRCLAEDPTMRGFLAAPEGREWAAPDDGPVSDELAREVRAVLFGPAASGGQLAAGEFAPQMDIAGLLAAYLPEEWIFTPQTQPEPGEMEKFQTAYADRMGEVFNALGSLDLMQRTAVRREHGRVVLQIQLARPGHSWALTGEHYTVFDIVLTSAPPWRVRQFDLLEAGVLARTLASWNLPPRSLLEQQMAGADVLRAAGVPARFLTVPALWYGSHAPATWKEWQQPGLDWHARTPRSLCAQVLAASESKEATDVQYLAVRENLSALIGETPWLRARDAVRAGTMQRWEEVKGLCRPLLTEGLLSVPAAWQLFLAGCETNDWALAVQALKAREAFDARQGYKTIRRDLERIAGQPLWAAFQKSPEGAAWFAEFQKLETKDLPPSAPSAPALPRAPRLDQFLPTSPRRSSPFGFDAETFPWRQPATPESSGQPGPGTIR